MECLRTGKVFKRSLEFVWRENAMATFIIGHSLLRAPETYSLLAEQKDILLKGNMGRE